MYYGDFHNERDVLREFGVSDFEGVIVFAAYETEDYDGSANVIFVKDGKFYLVYGAHCSCHGLEECWDPVEMPIAGLRRMIYEGCGPMKHYAEEIEKSLSFVEELGLDDASAEQVQIALKLLYG